MNRLITFVIASFLSSVSFAGLFVYDPENATEVSMGLNGENCHLSAMSIDSMTNLLPGGDDPEPLPVNATDCYAVTSPDNDFASEYSPNRGDLADGMFNGEIKTFNDPDNPGTKIDYYVDPNLFLDDLVNDTWVDANTPGWISLASINGAETDFGDEDDVNDDLDPFEVTYSKVGDYDLNLLLDIAFGIDDQGMGFWSIEFNPENGDIIGDIEEILGRPTRFDHLSFVLKGANKEPWYMYDFSFWDLMTDPDTLLDVDLNAPHNIFGSWDPTLFFGDKAVSHIEIVAHDPPSPSVIPEPQSSVIFTLGLLLLALRYKMKV